MKYKNIEKSFSQKRNVLGEVLPLNTPYTVLIDISDMCNLRCNYCFRYDDSIEAIDYKKNRLMNWETFKKVVEQLKEFPEQVKRISLSNHGEPLCNRLLPEMVKYIKQAGLSGKTEVHTNAILLDEEYVRALCEARIDRVVISIQGVDAQSYEEVCGVKIDFEHLVEMISLFYKEKTNTQICVKIVDVAVRDKEELFYDIFSPIADRVFVERVVPLWTGENLMDKNSVSNKYGDLFEVQECCPLIFYTINILSDGTIYPCSHIAPPFKLGSVYDTTIKKAWESNQRKEFLKKMLTDSRFANDVCKNCFVPQNTVMTKEDSIDFYRSDILKRM